MSLISAVMASLITATAIAENGVPRLSDRERKELLDEIRSALTTQTGWPQIHAAEALIAHGRANETLSTFRPLAETAPLQERIGVWRVLAQAEPAEEARREMVGRLRRAFLDVNGPDRLHAVETLAKLRVELPEDERRAVREFAKRPAAEAAFAHWLLALSGDVTSRKSLVEMLQDAAPVARQRAAYSLAQLADALSEAERKAASDAARSEPADSAGRITLIGVAAKIGEDREQFLRQLIDSTRSTDAESRRQSAMWLGEAGRPDDQAALAALRRDDDPRVRLAAANARLRIDMRMGR